MKTSTIFQLLLSVTLVSTTAACTDAQINQVAQALAQVQQQAANGRQAQANPNQQQPQGPTGGQAQPGHHPNGQPQLGGQDPSFDQGRPGTDQQAFGQGQPQGQGLDGQMGAPRGDGAMQPPPPPAGHFGKHGGMQSPMNGAQPPQGPQPQAIQQQAAL